ncbi:MAG: hypothetical protein HY913_04320 [Desulfomonile tiedjei]|nr:hypothetical protein [Desulfomonile tiedjei]
MNSDNVIKPHLIRWTPGVREMDVYFQEPTPENLDRLIQFFKKDLGENNLATKLLAVTLPLFLKLERLIPHQLLGDQARQDPKFLRIALFAFCGETINGWSDELLGLFDNSSRLQELLFPAMNDRGEIRPKLMRWEPEGPELDSYIESPTKENLDRLLYYLSEQQQVFLKLFSVSFSHLVNVQDKVFNSVGNEFPSQDIKQARKCFFVLSAEMSNKWASKYAALCTNPMLVYEGVRSSLEKVIPPKS